MSDHGRAEDKPVSSSSLPLPEGNGQGTQSEARSASASEVRIAELKAQCAIQQLEGAQLITQMRLADA